MTASASASIASARLHSPGCRPWCGPSSECEDGLHLRQIARPWQDRADGPTFTLSMETHDEDGQGAPTIAISYSRDGLIADDSVNVSLATGRELAYSLLTAIASVESELAA